MKKWFLLSLALGLSFAVNNCFSGRSPRPLTSFIMQRSNESMFQSPTHAPFTVKVDLVEVYESTTPPPGARGVPPRGYAVARFRVENLLAEATRFDLQTIEIQHADNNQVLLSQAMQPLRLEGLQIVEQGVRLTNPQGFEGVHRVRASVTYRLGGDVYRVESDTRRVVVYP